MSDHEHDEHGNCILPENPLYPGGLATWRFSPWDIIGIGLTGVGGLFTVGGQACNLLAREFSAMANYSRQNYDLREAQAEWDANQAAVAEDLRRLVEGDPS